MHGHYGTQEVLLPVLPPHMPNWQKLCMVNTLTDPHILQLGTVGS